MTPLAFAALLWDGDPADIQAAFDAVYEQRGDLLEALRRARSEIGYFRRHAPGVLPVGHELVAMETMQLIDAAIAKAEVGTTS